ncbi:MAG: methyltransferase family protein [Opitutaceae bacterium]
MNVLRWLIVGLWAVFFVSWAVMARGAKRNVGSRRWGPEVGIRAAILVIVILLLRMSSIRHALAHSQATVLSAGISGLILCLAGMGLAIWARICLGRSWGMPGSRKEHPELVTMGPYARVRNPIYAGMLLAMLGSAIGESGVWYVPLVLFGIYFFWSARAEEKLKQQEFPREYEGYRQRTKMFIPFVV